MPLDELTVDDLVRGYQKENAETYTCLTCGERFTRGEVYPLDGHFYEARRAAEAHVVQHGAAARRLLAEGSKYNTLTENQAQLLRLFAGGLADKDVARELGLSPSTVRHQKFVFREKAKQAKLYLAQYESVFGPRAEGGGDSIIPIHDNARYVDDRYVVTEEERQQILQSVFSSLEPLRLKSFPRKDKKKVVILTELAKRFEPGRQYAEKEVNTLLEEVFDDYVTLRRYLIDYGFLGRTKDGERYWLC